MILALCKDILELDFKNPSIFCQFKFLRKSNNLNQFSV